MHGPMYIKLTELISLHKAQKQPTSLNDRQTELDCAGGDLCNSSRVGEANLPALQSYHNPITKG